MSELTGIRSGDGAKMKAEVLDDRVVFRGAIKEEVPFEDIVAEVRGTLLVLSFRGHVVELGAGAKANQLASKIRSPPSRLDKLGIPIGATAAIAGAVDPAFRRELETRAVVATGVPKDPVDVLLWQPAGAAQLEAMAKLAPLVAPGGKLWVLLVPGQEPKEAQVAGAAKAAGLKAGNAVRLGPTQVAVPIAKGAAA